MPTLDLTVGVNKDSLQLSQNACVPSVSLWSPSSLPCTELWLVMVSTLQIGESLKKKIAKHINKMYDGQEIEDNV